MRVGGPLWFESDDHMIYPVDESSAIKKLTERADWLTSAGCGEGSSLPHNPLSELDHVEVFRRTYGSSERGFGLGCQRPWIDEPARAEVGEDEPPYAGRAGRLSCIGRR